MRAIHFKNSKRVRVNKEVVDNIARKKLTIAQLKEIIIKAYIDGDSRGCGCYDYITKKEAEEYADKLIKNEEINR